VLSARSARLLAVIVRPASHRWHCRYPCFVSTPAHTEIAPSSGVSAPGGLSEPKEAVRLADRRAGPRQGPYVPSPGGGKQPRSRNENGTWRKKRSDTGKPRGSKKKGK
jgi:hypothetical protein